MNADDRDYAYPSVPTINFAAARAEARAAFQKWNQHVTSCDRLPCLTCMRLRTKQDDAVRLMNALRPMVAVTA